MLDCMKRQLIECCGRSNKNFGFGTILCSCFFERVPSLSPRETVRGHVALLPAVCRWATLLPRLGGGRTIEVFDDTFFDLWSQQISIIKDYPYVGINFSRDLDMSLPFGAERGEIGTFAFKSFFFLIFLFDSFHFYFLYIYIIFMCTRVFDNYVSVMYRCGTSASNRFCEEQATSSTRGNTNSGRRTSSNNRGTSNWRG